MGGTDSEVSNFGSGLDRPCTGPILTGKWSTSSGIPSGRSISQPDGVIRAPIGVRIFENFYSITTGAGGLARILDAFADPDAPQIIESHRNRVHDVRFTGNEFDSEAIGHRHFADRFLR